MGKRIDQIRGRILGLDPGSRWIGYGVLDHGVPTYLGTIDCRVRSRGTTALRCKVQTVVGRLLQDFRPETVVIEEPTNDEIPHMRALRLVLQEIDRLVTKAGVRKVYLSPRTARAALCGDGFATKEIVAATIAYLHPELRSWLVPKNLEQVSRFVHHSADAVAVGMGWERD